MKVQEVKSCCFLDITIGEQDVGRIVVEMFENEAPKAVENFIALCSGSTQDQDGNQMSYKGNYFHGSIKNFVVQAGDLENCKDVANYPSAGAGSSNSSVFGTSFEDENLTAKLDKPFKLCCVNFGRPHSNGSQFFITTFPQPHLTGKHTVFGQVIHGKSVVRAIERVSTDDKNIPKKEEMVVIKDCGVWTDDMVVPVFNACYDPVGGDIYEEYPDDDENIDKDSSELVYEASVIIKDSGGILFKRGSVKEAYLKYTKCLRYVMEYIPDEDQEPEWFKKYFELKKKLYLNLSLVCLQLKMYNKVLDYSSIIIDMQRAPSNERAKAFYRRGSALMENKNYESALEDFQRADQLVKSDPAITQALDKSRALIEGKKKREKANYAKFFS